MWMKLRLAKAASVELRRIPLPGGLAMGAGAAAGPLPQSRRGRATSTSPCSSWRREATLTPPYRQQLNS
ncbi:TPA: hypothetical protein ACH3X3_009164 [Trebouxia sp. C0006]